MIDFKLILIAILCVAIYVLFNKLSKNERELKKVKIELNEINENKQEDRKKYLENFYDSNSESQINNISVLEETTEDPQQHFVNDNVPSPQPFVAHENSYDIPDEPENINDKDIQDCFEHDEDNDDSQEMITYSNQEEEKINIDVDEIIDSEDNDEPPELELFNSNEPEYLQKKPSTYLNVDDYDDNNQKQSIDVELDYEQESTESSEEPMQIKDSIEDNFSPEEDRLVLQEDKTEKESQEAVKRIINGSNYNKFRLLKLQKLAGDLNINIEKEVKGKVTNKTRKELWNEISSRTQ